MKVRNKTNRNPKLSQNHQRARRRRLAARQKKALDFQTLEDRRMLAVITVSSLADNMDVDGMVTLREAIQAANTDSSVDGSVAGSGADTIEFSAAALSGQTITLGGSDLEITEALTIDATALSQNVTIDANNASRIFNISASTGDFNLTGLTLTGGRSTVDFGHGGAVRSLSSGTLTITRSTVTSNSIAGTGSRGGGVFSLSDLTLISSTVSNNSTDGGPGGGIDSFSGTVTLIGSTVSGNSTAGNFGTGGGVSSFSGNILLTNSTVSGNSTLGSLSNGGGISSGGTVTLSNSTVTDNHTKGGNSRGGGISNNNDTVTLHNTILAGNTAVGGNPDLDSGTGALIVNFSLIGTGITPDAGGSGNLFSDDPLLGPLVNNGGFTKTHALLSSSPAIDAGDPSITFDASLLDQRGGPFVRVFDDAVAAGNRIDIGAFERQSLSQSSFMVDFDFDEINGDYSAGDLSLREAVSLANGSVGADVIAFSSALAGHTILLSSAIAITDSVSIVADNPITLDAGDGSDGMFATGDGFRIFTIDDGDATHQMSITLDGLTLTGGDTANADSGSEAAGGGAIFSRENLVIVDSILTANATGDGGQGENGVGEEGPGENGGSGGNGGAIWSQGTLTLDGTVVSGNRTGNGGRGGVGILGFDGISGGRGGLGRRGGNGGGIWSEGALVLTESTVTGNTTGNGGRGGSGYDGGRGGTGGNGGGIWSQGAVAISDSVVSGNETGKGENGGNTNSEGYGGGGGRGGNGGGIYNFDSEANTLAITRSTVSGNRTGGGGQGGDGGPFSRYGYGGNGGSGGGIRFLNQGSFVLTSSTVSGNTTGYGGGDGSNYAIPAYSGVGGGIINSGSLSVIGSTISGNRSSGSSSVGGGIYSSGEVTLSQSTVTDNLAGIAREIWNDDDTINISNSIVAGNNPNSVNPDIEPGTGALNVNFSLIEQVGLSLVGAGNTVGLSPNLGPLADNGGPTQTHALLAGSLAIDAGSNALAVDENGIPLTTDQRGDARIQSGTVDIGAVEFGDPFLLGDASLDGVVDFADIAPFIGLLSGTNFLDQADIDRNGMVDFNDIAPFINLLAGGSSNAISQSFGGAPPVSSAVSVVDVSEPESITSDTSTVEEPITVDTSDAIAEPAEVAGPTKPGEWVESDSLQPVEASQPSTVASLPPVVAPLFNPDTGNWLIAPLLTPAVEYRLAERQPQSSSTPLRLVGGLAGFESPSSDGQLSANDFESDPQETEVVDPLDETFATYADDLELLLN